MLSINTNLSSLIAQRSMKQSTNKLNQAIERMTTGAKINHAKDNAANYNIATNMTTKLGALQVAEDNCAMGLDMLTTANGTLDQIHDKLQRLRDLAVQSSNGTYGSESKQAINSEANALVDEIERLYGTSQYNGISLYDQTKGAGCDMESLPTVGPSGFIKEVKKRDTSNMATLASVDENVALTTGTYSISTAEELAKLATMTNKGLIGEDTEFVLANDIDLGGYANWTPIGNLASLYAFSATLDGNGYVVKNLTVSSPSMYRTGLFGATFGATIKNIGIEDAKVVGIQQAGLLIGIAEIESLLPSSTKPSSGSLISNCYAKGQLEGKAAIGGLIGITYNCKNFRVESCYTDVEVHGIYDSSSTYNSQIGGLVGNSHSDIKNCFSLGDVIAETGVAGVGGLCGQHDGIIENSYSTGDVSGALFIGGLVGYIRPYFFASAELVNCFSSGKVSVLGTVGSGSINAGGLVGVITVDSSDNCIIKNCTTQNKIVTSLSDTMGIFSLAGTSTSNQGVVEIINSLYDGTENQEFCICPEGIKVHNLYDISSASLDVNLGLQIGVNSEESSSINLTSSFKLGGLYSLRSIGLDDSDYLTKIDSMLGVCSAKSTEYGATENRLESALEEISTQYENLVSSRSTLRDADIADISSEYIRQQILQQASATLLATANQSPSIALQLI